MSVLNDEERRLYACGMAARRRGESKPKEHLPFEQYKYWRMGWRRAGKHLAPIMRSDDHTTLCQGRHVVRTEVESLDQALDVIAIKQQVEKARKTKKAKVISPPTKQQFLKRTRGSQQLRGHTRKRQAEVALRQSTASALEHRQVERIQQAIRLLCFAIEECSMVAAMQRFYPAINQKALIDLVMQMTKMIRQPMPEFGVARLAGQRLQTRRCINCAAELGHNEVGYCLHCEPPDASIKIASDMRREYHRDLAGLKHETKQLSNLINDLEMVVEHGDD